MMRFSGSFSTRTARTGRTSPIKTLDGNGNEIHGLEHAVETVLDLGGKQLTLRKVYSEKVDQKAGCS